MNKDQFFKWYNQQCNKLKDDVKAGIVDFEQCSKRIEELTSAYIEAIGQRPPAMLETHFDITKKPGKFRHRHKGITTLEELSNLLNYLIEQEMKQAAREQAAERSREQWEVLESEGYLPSKCTMEDVKRVLDDWAVAGIITFQKAEQVLNEFRECEYFRCKTAFWIGEKGAGRPTKYCSNRCRTQAMHARKREKKTGTQLTQPEYIPNWATSEQRYWEKQRVFMPDLRDKNGEEVSFAEWIDEVYDAEATQQETLRKLREKERIKELEEMNRKAPVVTYNLKDLPEDHELRKKYGI